jgi:glycosyltransferase involved in cell wall biosynthesis
MVQVSLIATFYNKAPFVADVVASMTGQTGLHSSEVILVDDGSTDGTPQALEAAVAGLDNARIVRQDNAGPSAALNAGLGHARGDFVKFVDGDDALRDGSVRAMIDAAEAAGADTVAGEIMIGDIADAMLRACAGYGDGVFYEKPLDRLVRDWQINPSQVLVRRDLVQRVGGADPRVFIQDFSLMLRLAHAGPFVRLSEAVAIAPQQAEGRLTDNAAQILHDLNLATVLFLNDAPGVDGALRRAFLNRVWERAYKWAARRGSGVSTVKTLIRRTAFRLGLGPAHGPGLLAAAAPFAEADPVRLTEDGRAALRAAGVRHPALSRTA